MIIARTRVPERSSRTTRGPTTPTTPIPSITEKRKWRSTAITKPVPLLAVICVPGHILTLYLHPGDYMTPAIEGEITLRSYLPSSLSPKLSSAMVSSSAPLESVGYKLAKEVSPEEAAVAYPPHPHDPPCANARMVICELLGGGVHVNPEAHLHLAEIFLGNKAFVAGTKVLVSASRGRTIRPSAQVASQRGIITTGVELDAKDIWEWAKAARKPEYALEVSAAIKVEKSRLQVEELRREGEPVEAAAAALLKTRLAALASADMAEGRREMVAETVGLRRQMAADAEGLRRQMAAMERCYEEKRQAIKRKWGPVLESVDASEMERRAIEKERAAAGHPGSWLPESGELKGLVKKFRAEITTDLDHESVRSVEAREALRRVAMAAVGEMEERGAERQARTFRALVGLSGGGAAPGMAPTAEGEKKRRKIM